MHVGAHIPGNGQPRTKALENTAQTQMRSLKVSLMGPTSNLRVQPYSYQGSQVIDSNEGREYSPFQARKYPPLSFILSKAL